MSHPVGIHCVDQQYLPHTLSRQRNGTTGIKTLREPLLVTQVQLVEEMNLHGRADVPFYSVGAARVYDEHALSFSYAAGYFAVPAGNSQGKEERVDRVRLRQHRLGRGEIVPLHGSKVIRIILPRNVVGQAPNVDDVQGNLAFATVLLLLSEEDLLPNSIPERDELLPRLGVATAPVAVLVGPSEGKAGAVQWTVVDGTGGVDRRVGTREAKECDEA
mmetsp:Transcript_50666/g.107971  ORF Transcript_50666/g.107971 Transcript_50666/m.107971 type:complete len:217 (-) Transcript_50666:77-727(-)